MSDQEALDEFLDKTVERLLREGYLRASEAQPFVDPTGSGGGHGPEGPPVKFELTEKTVDFLGFRALRDLLGSLGKSSFGRHDTRDLATGVEASGPSKEWEFGDTMNLDVSGTLLNAIGREGLTVPLDVDYSDLQVRLSPSTSPRARRSSCSTARTA